MKQSIEITFKKTFKFIINLYLNTGNHQRLGVRPLHACHDSLYHSIKYSSINIVKSNFYLTISLFIIGELIEQAFTLFTVLVESSYFMHCFSENELAVVFQFMKYHEDCRDVQYTGMCFLVELAKNKASHECLIRNNVDDIMLRAQANYPKCAAMQRKCIELLNLLCESLLDTENSKSELVSAPLLY